VAAQLPTAKMPPMVEMGRVEEMEPGEELEERASMLGT
jgi:hypothetical protein